MIDKEKLRLLAINFGGLGDEVLFLPTLQAIRQQHASWHITLLVEPRGSSIKHITDLIDDILIFDIKKKPLRWSDYVQLVQMLRGGKFDCVVSSGSSAQVSGLLFLSGIKQRIGYGASQLARFLLTCSIPLNRSQHAACMYHDLSTGLGVKSACSRPEITVDSSAIEKMSSLIGGKQQSTRFVLIHPGTSQLAIKKGIIKTWNPQNWSYLIDSLIAENCRVILSGGPDDAEVIDGILAALHERGSPIDRPEKFLNMYGKTGSLQDLIALIQLSDLLICVDSAPMHLAVALDKPLVALFGPTDPAKLLWKNEKFKWLRDEVAAELYANIDPFTQRPTFQSSQPQPEPYVQIQPDIVFRTAMDQLKTVSSP